MSHTTDVLVVGAGPVGLMLAAELRRRGVSCRIIDKLTEPMNWVKALGVSQRTLEVWDHLGIATEALDAGLILRKQRVFLNRELVLDAEAILPDEAPYRYPLILPQPETERILGARLARCGGVVERGVELQSYTADSDGVLAVLSTPQGQESVHCSYLVGCDGAHSTVRRGLGLPFEGGKFPVEFLLADVELGWEFEHAAACLFLETRDDHLENLLVCIPYRDTTDPGKSRYRVSTMARPVSEANWEGENCEASQEAASRPTLDDVRALVARFVPVPVQVSELRWSSVFRISHRIVSRYRVGRVFLAGDAAHIHPPTGGQGMNTGLQDAHNLAWKLALDLQGKAAPDLLDSYEAERRPVGLAVVERTKQRSMNFADRSTHDIQAQRDDSQLFIHYRGSPWVMEQLTKPDALAGGPQPGDRAPDVLGLRREGVHVPLRLFDLLRGGGFTLFAYGATALPADVLHRCRAAGIQVYRVTPFETDGELPTLIDAEGNFQRVYAAVAGTAYLVRPDGVVGFRTDGLDVGGLETYRRRVL
ncbi:MAG: FAD-dependent monooxygenase, partial [Planctomycetia bacterium]|nr:FAD-dependent monooxygenase [Planctomycetia bacterium]